MRGMAHFSPYDQSLGRLVAWESDLLKEQPDRTAASSPKGRTSVEG